jgi:hypothetical protein
VSNDIRAPKNSKKIEYDESTGGNAVCTPDPGFGTGPFAAIESMKGPVYDPRFNVFKNESNLNSRKLPWKTNTIRRDWPL